VARTIHRLAAKVAPHVSGMAVAAAVFRPNVVQAYMAGPFMLLAQIGNWRREDRAILDDGGLAPTTLLVVTAHDVYAFDAGLLAWNAVRKIAHWPRADLVAQAVPIAGPAPPAWTVGRFRPPPSLRLENRAGELLAELAPFAWNAAAKRVFAELGATPPS
jgi:hypothetical protein